MHTVAIYSGTCDKLDGFPGLLQSAGFLPIGNCKWLNPHRCNTEEECRVNGKIGHCGVEVIDHKEFCVCKPKRISK
jgi:hypothetical protein